MNTKISLIICTRNRATLVTRAIDSALAQQNVSLEVIVVDDCSEDGTPDMLVAKYGERIQIVRLNENRRVAYATNRGFDASLGEYIALLGDDDYWTDSYKLKKQLSIFFESTEKLGVVGTWWYEQGGDEAAISREPSEPADWKDRLLRGGGVICGSTPLIKRTAWMAVGGMDERISRGTDSDLFRRIILAGFTARILAEHTTVVDTGHGLTRMTTARGRAEARRHAFVNAYLLWKYRSYYMRYPGAMYSRIKGLILAPLRSLF